MEENSAAVKRDSTGSIFYQCFPNLSRSNKDVFRTPSGEDGKYNMRQGSNLDRYEHSRRIFASLVVYYNRHDAWLTPLPWNTKVRLQPEDMHVKLEVLLPDPEKRRFSKGHSKKIRDLFEPSPGSRRPPKNVLIYGDPGYGKTMLCRKIAYFWAAQGKTLPGFSENHTVVVYLKLRTLSEDAFLENELIKLVLQEERFSTEDPFFRRIRRTLQVFGRNVIVILDGYDEVSDWHQNQIKSLLKSESSSVFKDASVIVTARPEHYDDLLPLFQKYLILKAFSNRSTQKLIQRYFPNSPMVSETLYKNMKTYNLEHLSPLIVHVLCYLIEQERQEDFVSSQRLLRLLVPLVVRSSNERQNSGLPEDQLEAFLLRLGEFFLGRVDTDGTFTHRDIEEGFPELSNFVITSGLFRTVTFGFEDVEVIMEPVNSVLTDSLIAYYLEEKWTSCIVDGGFSSFCDTTLHWLDTLHLCFNLHRVNSEDFTASFNYRHFRFLYQVSDKVESCFVITSAKETNKSQSNGNSLSATLVINLDDEETCSAVIETLKAIFPESKAHRLIPDLILGGPFRNVRVMFVTDSDAVAFGWFERSDDTGSSVPRPWSSLTKISTKLHISLTKSWCAPQTICPLLKELLEMDLNIEENGNENLFDVIKVIRKQRSLLPFEEAEASFPKAHVKSTTPEFRVSNKVPFFLRLFTRQNFSLQNCDLLELRFCRLRALSLSLGLSTSTSVIDLPFS